MSWIRNLEEDFINLDHVTALFVVEFEGGEGDFCVAARIAGETNEHVLFTGSETQCRNHLSKILSKLPRIQL